jgi:enediyne biosynthesis protein E4
MEVESHRKLPASRLDTRRLIDLKAICATSVAIAIAVSAGCGSLGSSKIGPPPIALQPSAAVPRFQDIARQAGLNYQWVVHGSRPLTILGTIGNGCAFLDYDNDGNLDILLVGDRVSLYKGDGRGHFVDVSHQTHLDQLHGHFLGCAVGDYDNDGYEDIYLTAYRGGVLLHNEHGKYFTDVTKQAGIAPQPWGTSAAFVDVDNDGKLDLFIGNYVDFGPATVPQLCPLAGHMTTCGPQSYKSLRGALYRNLGNGRFVDVTNRCGLGSLTGPVLGVAPADFDSSGRQSIYIANDDKPANLLKNTGGDFVDDGVPSGTSGQPNGNAQAGMGADWGDYDNDGRLDLAVETFSFEAKPIYHNDGNDLFTDQSANLGVRVPLLPYLSFGVKWLDDDNSGWLDLMTTNGSVYDNVHDFDSNETYRQKTLLLQNDRGTRFGDASASLIGDADRPIVGRGLAIGDFENDGRVGALIVDSEGAPILLQNITPQVGHWFEFNLIGTKSNRDGLGSLVTVDAGGLKQVRLCSTAGSYMSASDKRVHVGIGAATVADSVTVQWPSGHIDTYHDLAADRQYTLREGAGAVVK